MSKKHWISVKRGLSEDPKHRQAMGEAIWLFLHIVDAADWETGIVYDWKDRSIACDMSLSTATVRGWRDRLADKGYITCVQKQHSLDIVIHNWIDPRNYSGRKMNAREGDMDISPSENEKTQENIQGESQVDTEVDMQGDTVSIAKPASFIVPTSTSTSPSHKREKIVIPGIEASIMAGRPTTQVDIEVSKNAWPGREVFKDHARELIDVYVELTGQHPTKGQLSGWMADSEEWLEIGISSDDLRATYRKANPDNGDGFLVARPGSLTRVAGMIAGERRKKVTSHVVLSTPTTQAIKSDYFDPSKPFFQQFPKETA